MPQVLSLNQFTQLLKAAEVEDPLRTQRNQITLLLLFGLGCRVSELIALNLHDFSETDGWLSVIGKGNKQRLVPVTESLLVALKKYLREVRPNLVKDQVSSILINERGHRPSRVDIWRWLDAWSKKAGFERTVYPHQFRHGCATALLEAGADLRSIQMLLGHASLQTTQIYTSVTSHKLQEAIEENHPLGKLR